MNILALETSTEVGSCALLLDGEVLERVCPPGLAHSATLLPLVRSLMAEAGLSFSQLSAVAFGAGPGAFTGLRVACGAAQGIGVAADLPLVPVVTLEAMAEAAGAEKVFSVLDARMGEVYFARCERQNDGHWLTGEIRLSAPDMIPLPEPLAMDAAPVAVKLSDWLACGNALAVYPALAERISLAGMSCRPEVFPMAGNVARLGAVLLKKGQSIDPADAGPLYVRDKVAKTIAERLHEGGRA